MSPPVDPGDRENRGTHVKMECIAFFKNVKPQLRGYCVAKARSPAVGRGADSRLGRALSLAGPTSEPTRSPRADHGTARPPPTLAAVSRA